MKEYVCVYIYISVHSRENEKGAPGLNEKFKNSPKFKREREQKLSKRVSRLSLKQVGMGYKEVLRAQLVNSSDPYQLNSYKLSAEFHTHQAMTSLQPCERSFDR